MKIDVKILDPRVAGAEMRASLAKLAKAQTSLGAFPWWPGGPPSPYMTLYILYGFSKGLEFGVDACLDANRLHARSLASSTFSGAEGLVQPRFDRAQLTGERAPQLAETIT